MEPRFQGYLSDRDIEEHRTQLFPNESDEIKPVGASVELSLGSEYHLSSQRESQRLSADKPHLLIPSGDFAVLMTKETVCVPDDVIGFITMRFTYKAKGLINVSGFHVDPGYKGRLLYAVYNAGPNDILVSHEEKLFMIFFSGLNQPAKEPYYRPGHTELPGWAVANLISGSNPTNIASLAQSVRRLEDRFTLALSTLAIVMVPVIILIVDRWVAR